jgi:Phage integrase family/Putative transposase
MIPYGARRKTISGVFAPDEIAQLLRAARSGRNRIPLKTAYALSLRLDELFHLRVRDIDGRRRFVHVRHGKGAKDRLVPISDRLLTELRGWWRVRRPPLWLFPGGRTVQQRRRAASLPRHPHRGRHPQARFDESLRWAACRPGFFLPVRVFSRVFRGKFRDGLRRLFRSRTGGCWTLISPTPFSTVRSGFKPMRKICCRPRSSRHSTRCAIQPVDRMHHLRRYLRRLATCRPSR